MKWLALDQGTKTGWAFGPPGQHPRVGTFTLAPKLSTGEYLYRFNRWLDEFITAERVEAVIFESPITPEKTSLQTMRKLYSLAGQIELICHTRIVACREVHMQRWRKHFLGFGIAPEHIPKGEKGEFMKQTAFRLCLDLGIMVDSPDCAEAVGIWNFVNSPPAHPYITKTAKRERKPITDVTL